MPQPANPATPGWRFILIQSALMSLVMDIAMSTYFLALNFGLTRAMLYHWPRAFLMAYPVAFATVMVVGGPVRALAGRLSAPPR